MEKKPQNDGEEDISNGKRKTSMLLFLKDSRSYIRVIAVLIMIVSLSLVSTAIITFSKARKRAGNPLNNVPKNAPITDHPCIVFSGVAVMNLVFSISIVCVSCISSKVRPQRFLSLGNVAQNITVQQEQQRHQCNVYHCQCYWICKCDGRLSFSEQADFSPK